MELAVPLQTQALAARQVDALLTVEPVITIASSQGVSKILIESPNLRYVSNPFYAGVGNVSTEFIAEHPQEYAKVVEVLSKATKEINSNPEAARQFLVGFTPLTAELAKIVHLPVYKMYADLTEKDIDAVQKFIDVFVRYKVIENPITAKHLIYAK